MARYARWSLSCALALAGCGTRTPLDIGPSTPGGPVDGGKRPDTGARDSGPDGARDSGRDSGPRPDAPTGCRSDGDCSYMLGDCVMGYCDWSSGECYRGPLPEYCFNGEDDNCDGLADCADYECLSEPACSPGECPSVDLGSAVGWNVFSGTASGASAFEGSCGGAEAPELTVLWVAPNSGRFRITTRGSDYDTLIYVRTSCDGDELPNACDDDSGGNVASALTLFFEQGEQVAIVLDGYGSDSTGQVWLSIRPQGGPGPVPSTDAGSAPDA